MKNVFRSFLPALLSAVAFLFSAAAARAQTYSVVYSFQGHPDGGNPFGGLVSDAAGNLYGTTVYGGPPTEDPCDQGCGTVFEISSTGSESILSGFDSTTTGRNPEAALIRDPQGNLYGTTYTGGGTKGYKFGTVFELSASGVYTVLHTFQGGTDGGDFPDSAPLVRDSAGNLYGVTGGGLTCGTSYCGEVFKVTPAGVKSVFYSFPGGAAGSGPVSLFRDSTGTFYGAAVSGGGPTCSPFGCGVLFKIDASGTETVLYTFTGGAAGAAPVSLLLDSAGNLYGATSLGGDLTCRVSKQGCGILYKVGTTGTEIVLHTFDVVAAAGNYANSGVVRDSAGNLYGTTYQGGTYNEGMVYKLDTAGNFSVLHSFTGGSDGGYPQAGLIMDSGGNLYGTASYGADSRCLYGCGVVFKITP